MTMNFNVFQAAASLAWPGGVGVERDHARPAVRRTAAVRAGRRGPLPAADHDVRAVEGGQRDDRRAHRAVVGDPVRRAALLQHHGARGLPRFPSFWADPRARKWNLWGYIDERDVAAACRLALEARPNVAGSPSFIIAAADTVMDRPSADLMAEVFPGVPLTRDSGSSAPCCRSTAPGKCWASSRATRGATTYEAARTGRAIPGVTTFRAA